MQTLRITVALLITGLWAAGVILSFASSDFEMPASLSPAMLFVAGWLFTAGVREAIKRSNGNGSSA